jgi:hypothetical protein
MRRPKALEDENARLKKLVAGHSLDCPARGSSRATLLLSAPRDIQTW